MCESEKMPTTTTTMPLYPNLNRDERLFESFITPHAMFTYQPVSLPEGVCKGVWEKCKKGVCVCVGKQE